LFRNPRYSGSTSANLATTPELATSFADVYRPLAMHGPRAPLNCNFTNAIDPWLRLTTANAPELAERGD